MKYQVMPPLTTEEKEALRASIEMEGVRDPIIVDENGSILDGHHRYEIDPDAPRKVIEGLTEAEKLAFAIRSNMARRNMSPAQKKEVQRKQKETAKKLREQDPVTFTNAVVGAMLGVDESTIRYWLNKDTSNRELPKACSQKLETPQAETVQEEEGSDHWQNCHDPEPPKQPASQPTPEPPPRPDARVKIPPQHREYIYQRIEAGETQEQVAADYGATQQQISSIYNKERKQREETKKREQQTKEIKTDCGIHHGDFRNLGSIIPDNSVDLIFTDPPYDEEAASLYGDLAKFAARVLRPGGWCLAYSGQTWLLQVLTNMAIHLNYGWLFAVHHTGGDFRYRKLHLQNKWKPIAGFYKPPLNTWWNWFPDMASGGKEKTDHEWQQALGEAEHFIKALSPEGGLICDPFAGSGTGCLAAKNTGRKWVAFEVKQETAERARLRVYD